MFNKLNFTQYSPNTIRIRKKSTISATQETDRDYKSRPIQGATIDSHSRAASLALTDEPISSRPDTQLTSIIKKGSDLDKNQKGNLAYLRQCLKTAGNDTIGPIRRRNISIQPDS